MKTWMEKKRKQKTKQEDHCDKPPHLKWSEKESSVKSSVHVLYLTKVLDDLNEQGPHPEKKTKQWLRQCPWKNYDWGNVHGLILFLGIKSVYDEYEQKKQKVLLRQLPRFACTKLWSRRGFLCKHISSWQLLKLILGTQIKAEEIEERWLYRLDYHINKEAHRKSV